MKNSKLTHWLRIHLEAWHEVWNRYRTIGRAAWSERANYDAKQRNSQEAEFLPAALAVQETPVHPIPRVAALLLVGLLGLGLIASIVLKTEIIVSAPGQLVPSGRTKSIQALESALVQHIYVREGQLVKAGDLIADLFVPGVGTDSARQRAELNEANNEYQRGQQLLLMIDTGRSPANGSDLLAGGRLREYLDKVARYEAEIERKRIETETARVQVRKYELMLPNLRQKVADYRQLEKQGYIASHAVLDQMQVLNEAESEHLVQENRVRESLAQLAESQRGLAALNSEVRRSTLEQMRDASVKRQLADQDFKKFASRDQLMQLRAPIDGYVQQINVHTVGGVIGATQVLMNIVPVDDPLEVEVTLDNKDIGRLNPGMTAQVKVDTFPFTRFGTVPATLKMISSDAIQDEKKGPVYKARLNIARPELSSGNDVYKLSAGMTTTAEIKIGYRRVIHYFLDPFMRSMGESIREW